MRYAVRTGILQILLKGSYHNLLFRVSQIIQDTTDVHSYNDVTCTSRRDNLNSLIISSWEQSPLWLATRSISTAYREIPCTLQNPNIYYRVHTGHSHGPSLSYINLIYILSSLSFKNHFNIIIPAVPRSFKWCLSFRFHHQNSV